MNDPKCPACGLPLYGTGHVNSDGTNCPLKAAKEALLNDNGPESAATNDAIQP